MFCRKRQRSERVCYADIVNRLPRRIIDRDMVMPAPRAFASGYIDRDTMMRWIDGRESGPKASLKSNPVLAKTKAPRSAEANKVVRA
jgi:hypothetical protein